MGDSFGFNITRGHLFDAINALMNSTFTLQGRALLPHLQNPIVQEKVLKILLTYRSIGQNLVTIVNEVDAVVAIRANITLSIRNSFMTNPDTFYRGLKDEFRASVNGVASAMFDRELQTKVIKLLISGHSKLCQLVFSLRLPNDNKNKPIENEKRPSPRLYKDDDGDYKRPPKKVQKALPDKTSNESGFSDL